MARQSRRRIPGDKVIIFDIQPITIRVTRPQDIGDHAHHFLVGHFPTLFPAA